MKQVYLLFAVLFVALFVGCSSDTEDLPQDPPQDPPSPRLNVKDSLIAVEVWREAGGEHWPLKWDLKNFFTWAGMGIALDTDKNEYRILQLYLNTFNDNSTAGTLSAKIGELEELRFFYISGLGITGEIPKSLGKLKHLRELRICYTSMTGTIPQEIFLLPYLQSLQIDNNKFIGGEIPEEITQMPPTVQRCQLFFNNLSGKVPSGIQLKSLRLDGNQYTEYPFEYCKEGATYVNMTDNFITGVIPDSILNDVEAMRKLRFMTYHQQNGCRFTNAPNPWEY